MLQDKNMSYIQRPPDFILLVCISTYTAIIINYDSDVVHKEV